MTKYLCYCIQSKDKRGRVITYVGITNNFKRRLRQHNQEIKGGARYTKRGKNWRPIFQVRGFTSKIHALQFEWAMKHRRKTSNKGSAHARLKTLGYLFSLNKWTSSAPITHSMCLSIYYSGTRKQLLNDAGPELFGKVSEIKFAVTKEQFLE